ncbi:hypothetical protein H1Z61_13525 [Bacillus aquiflavi]|uniref:Uncharacterized protein n=1 Tax=Bacillus aquiflavi TaxID=2672567 RepID=A0A6B3W1U5_9BACI|nr:STM3941 family protein [Bacillus aquiflavi]MBA4538127.1 hypothetical protein [Bacillus aquiflavi]NEY82447.1 hypothetical protein [Bacillus aquiflavi]
MNDYVVYHKLGKNILTCFGAFAFVGFSILFIIFSFDSSGIQRILLMVVGLMGLSFFGTVMVYLMSILIKRKPALIISDTGIFDCSNMASGGMIKWEDIENFMTVEVLGEKFLGIITYDRDLIVNRTSGFKRFLIKGNRALVDAQVNIPVKTLACSIDELVEEINSCWQKACADDEHEYDIK